MEHPIFQKIEMANTLDFGDILSKSYELFKKVCEQALYHVLISMETVIPLMILIYVPYFIFNFSSASQDSYGANQEPNITPFIPILIIYVIVVFILIFQAIVLGIAVHFF